jgi:hypothetical protein
MTGNLLPMHIVVEKNALKVQPPFFVFTMDPFPKTIWLIFKQNEKNVSRWIKALVTKILLERHRFFKIPFNATKLSI